MSRARLQEADRKRAYAETSTTSYRLEPIRCPVCQKMGVWSYGLKGTRAVKHKRSSVRKETTYCEVSNGL